MTRFASSYNVIRATLDDATPRELADVLVIIEHRLRVLDEKAARLVLQAAALLVPGNARDASRQRSAAEHSPSCSDVDPQ